MGLIETITRIARIARNLSGRAKETFGPKNVEPVEGKVIRLAIYPTLSAVSMVEKGYGIKLSDYDIIVNRLLDSTYKIDPSVHVIIMNPNRVIGNSEAELARRLAAAAIEANLI
ncbi:MAG: hypothetical protein KatS3mg054_0145 [Chloroflexus sp.]|nr:MAG: hypothetical protein KatS3mg054_0145 [Chloroflexus sp.]